MMKQRTLIGIATYGNLPFTKLTIENILATTKHPIDLCIVVGKGDHETIDYTRGLADAIEDDDVSIWVKIHYSNHGFPACVNDIYDCAWEAWDETQYDNLIIIGNDVVPYPGAIDALIDHADTTDWEWIWASQYDVKTLIHEHPETAKYFQGENCIFTDFSARPWDAHKPDTTPRVHPNCIADMHNLCLFKRSVLDKVGYIDVNFFPAYFEDNDYHNRAVRAGVKACGLGHAQFFHFWSRTIHQGSGGSTSQAFENNRAFYVKKWGGVVGQEKFALPFDGKPFNLSPGVTLDPVINIQRRDQEEDIVDFWKNVGRYNPAA